MFYFDLCGDLKSMEGGAGDFCRRVLGMSVSLLGRMRDFVESSDETEFDSSI